MNLQLLNRTLDPVDEAILAAGELSPDQLLNLPKMKIFTGEMAAKESEIEGTTRRTLHCTASSTVQDLHGDSMTLDCIRDMADQARSKQLTIYRNHKYIVPDDVFGRTYAAQVQNSGERDADSGQEIWDLHLDIALASGLDAVDKTYSLIKNDQINLGVSIGAYILDYDFKDKDKGFWGGLTINKVLLVETSVVGIPANQRSWVQNGVLAIGKSLGLPERDIRKWLDGSPAPEISPLQEAQIALSGLESTITGITTTDNITVTVDNAADITWPSMGNAITNGTVTVTVTDSTSDPEEDPEDGQVTASAAPDGESTDDADAETTDEEQASEEEPAPDAALAEAAPDVALSLQEGRTPAAEILLAALEQAATELSASRSKVKELEAELDATKAERDQVAKDRDDAAEIIALVARSPLPRKTAFKEAIETFESRFAGLYDAGFLRLIDHKE